MLWCWVSIVIVKVLNGVWWWCRLLGFSCVWLLVVMLVNGGWKDSWWWVCSWFRFSSVVEWYRVGCWNVCGCVRIFGSWCCCWCIIYVVLV